MALFITPICSCKHITHTLCTRSRYGEQSVQVVTHGRSKAGDGSEDTFCEVKRGWGRVEISATVSREQLTSVIINDREEACMQGRLAKDLREGPEIGLLWDSEGRAKGEHTA
jgi:hypothetical protein